MATAYYGPGQGLVIGRRSGVGRICRLPVTLLQTFILTLCTCHCMQLRRTLGGTAMKGVHSTRPLSELEVVAPHKIANPEE